MKLTEKTSDEFCCLRQLINSEQATRFEREMVNVKRTQCAKAFSKCQRLLSLARKFRCKRKLLSATLCQSNVVLFALGLLLAPVWLAQSTSITSPASGSHELQQQHYLNQQQLIAQARAGGLEPGDYVDDAGELEILANQQQIPTAQLMSAAGHVVPENFFLPGGSVPAFYSRPYQHQQQGQQQQTHHQQQQAEPTQQLASQVQARHVSPLKYFRPSDLIAAASGPITMGASEQQDGSHLIDINGYNLVAGVTQQDGRELSSQDSADLVGQSASQEQQQHYAEQQIAAELAALAANQNYQQQLSQQNQGYDQLAQSSENSLIEHYAPSIGPAYQISSHHPQELASYTYEKNLPQKPFGLPTKSSMREPSDMLKPLGNPKTISSPAIDFIANQLPKTSAVDKLADKLPPVQTPTVFSFSSNKDPSEKVKGVNQKKRNVMRQAEHIARMMIKSFNDKFGTNIGDQSDLPFLISSLTPLGLAQNILFDPTLLVTLLNSAEKTYFSDVLPGPAKSAIRPVLNIFRVPNKKRDKANLLNILSFIASGGQTPSSTPSKHRQGTGVERASKSKS